MRLFEELGDSLEQGHGPVRFATRAIFEHAVGFGHELVAIEMDNKRHIFESEIVGGDGILSIEISNAIAGRF